MRGRLLHRFTNRVFIITVTLLTLVGCFALYVYTNKDQNNSAEEEYSLGQLAAARESSHVYIQQHPLYSAINPETRINVEKMIYGYAHLLNGNHLYTGVVREGSYQNKGSTTGMIIDVQPFPVAYSVSITKRPNQIDAILVACAPQPEQIDPSITCLDEQGAK